jgi:VWFA-related protein
MRQLARETGGQCFFATQIDELKSIYATIGNELAQQYALGYTPQNTNRNGAWRQVLVRLPGQPKARVRTRTGYFAEGPNRLTLTSTK